MRNIKILSALVVSLPLLLIVLKFLGIISFDIVELFTYISLITGFSIWYSSNFSRNKGGIYTGVFIFLTGIVLAVESFFTIWNPARMFIPSLFIISGLATLFIYLSDKKKFVFLILSVLQIIIGMVYLFTRINFKLNVFLVAIWELIINLWFVILIVVVIVYIISNHHLNDKPD